MKLLAALLISQEVKASHFRAVGFNVIQGNNGEVLVSRTIAYRWGYSGYGDGCTASDVANQVQSKMGLGETCTYVSGGACGSINPAEYIVTDVEDALHADDNFCYGYKQDIFVKPTGPYTITWGSTAWVPFLTDAGVVAGSGDYGFTASVFDVENNTPQIKLPPIWKIMSRCGAQTLDLSPIDLDGDTVKCVWATEAEALGAFGGNMFNSITLDSDTCILTYDGLADSGQDGVKPIAIQVQDFDANGFMRSSMPIQFLATVWTPTNPNFSSDFVPPQTRSDMQMDVGFEMPEAPKSDVTPYVYSPSLFPADTDHMSSEELKQHKKMLRKAEKNMSKNNHRDRREAVSYCFDSPTLSNSCPTAGSVLDAKLGLTVSLGAIPIDGVTITRFQYNSPLGMSCGSVTLNDDVYETECRWTPVANQMGQVFNFCFLAEDSRGFSSERRCIKLSAGADVPLTTPEGYPCPTADCWTFDEETNTCSMKDTCATIQCGATEFDITFKSALFHLEDDQSPVNFAGGFTPAWDGTKWATKVALDSTATTYTINDNDITFSASIGVVGSDMRERSDSIDDNEISLGAQSVITAPFGASVAFTCTYPMTIEAISHAYTVTGASVVDTIHSTGSLAAGFAMELNNGGAVHFQLGSTLPVAVTWSVTELSDLTYYLAECTVTHGSTDINVVKDGCYAEALGVTADEGYQGFSYQIFKANGVTAPEQTITCSVQICEVGKCQNPTLDNQCPSTGDDVYYLFKV